MTKTGVVVLAHGSRGERGKGEVEAALKRITVGLKHLIAPDTEVIGATLQFNQPGLEEAVALLSKKKVSRIVIAPYFLFNGRHITEHIPQLMGKLQCDYPGIKFVLADNLGLDESFTSVIAKRIKQAAPDLAPYSPVGTSSSIEQDSMRIIGRLLPLLPGLSEEELTVVKRIIHACGDAAVAHLIRFSQPAITSGLGAIARGTTIFTDVCMVKAGINRRLAEISGCSVCCALDEAGSTRVSNDKNTTRSAAAIRHLGAKLNGAIVIIGNAPTALLALLDLIDNKEIKPALVIGMPVGFVQARESKDELMKRDVPYITVIGTRGGSAMAAATVNSLLKIAADKRQCKSLNHDKGGISE